MIHAAAMDGSGQKLLHSCFQSGGCSLLTVDIHGKSKLFYIYKVNSIWSIDQSVYKYNKYFTLQCTYIISLKIRHVTFWTLT